MRLEREGEIKEVEKWRKQNPEEGVGEEQEEKEKSIVIANKQCFLRIY